MAFPPFVLHFHFNEEIFQIVRFCFVLALLFQDFFVFYFVVLIFYRRFLFFSLFLFLWFLFSMFFSRRAGRFFFVFFLCFFFLLFIWLYGNVWVRILPLSTFAMDGGHRCTQRCIQRKGREIRKKRPNGAISGTTARKLCNGPEIIDCILLLAEYALCGSMWFTPWICALFLFDEQCEQINLRFSPADVTDGIYFQSGCVVQRHVPRYERSNRFVRPWHLWYGCRLLQAGLSLPIYIQTRLTEWMAQFLYWNFVSLLICICICVALCRGCREGVLMPFQHNFTPTPHSRGVFFSLQITALRGYGVSSVCTSFSFQRGNLPNCSFLFRFSFTFSGFFCFLFRCFDFLSTFSFL